MAVVQLGTPTFVAMQLATAPTPPRLSGLQQVVGGDDALADSGYDSYIDLHQMYPAGTVDYYIDALAFPVLADIEFGDTLTITYAAADVRFRDSRICYSIDPVNTMGSFTGGIAGAWDIVTETYSFDYQGVSWPYPAGSTVYFYLQVAAVIDIPGQPPFTGTDFLTRIYLINGQRASVVPWLRVYPRHDQRLYPPTRSLGARPAGYP